MSEKIKLEGGGGGGDGKPQPEDYPDDFLGDYPGRMLHQAAIYNNVDFLTSLLQGEEAHHVNAQDPFGRTALYTSVTNNSLECARMLLEYGADANVSCGPQCGRMTALHAAALDNKHQFTRILLQGGADIYSKDASGESPLQLAVKNRSDECIAVIQEDMENRKKTRKDEEDKFYVACGEGDIDMAHLLGDKYTDEDKKRIINTIPEGTSGLLYKMCESGNEAMVEYLLGLGAEGQVHPVTGHSPLHAATHNGHLNIVHLIMQKFPELVQAPTIEGTLPLHIAAAEGHQEVFSLLLDFNYPSHVRKIFRQFHSNQLYRLGFPINAKDHRGESPLHIACRNNHWEIAKKLLDFKVTPFTKNLLFSPSQDTADGQGTSCLPGTHGSKGRDLESPDVKEATENLFAEQLGKPKDDIVELRPVEIDGLDLDGLSALHLSIIGDGTGSYHQVAQLLLEHGANPNKPLISTSGNTTALMEACQRGDVHMMDLLLKHQAQDNDQKVLSAAVLSKDDRMISTILKYKVFHDSEFKINRHAINLDALAQDESLPENGSRSWISDSGTLSLPHNPVAINWYHLGISKVSPCWLLEACTMHNAHLSGSMDALALTAITRIDISKNNIYSLPEELFMLKSLRLLNASENRLKSLPGCADIPSASTAQGDEPKLQLTYKLEDATAGSRDVSGRRPWNCPWLEEIQLEKNKLKHVHADIFHLPSLQKLNLSHNELEKLPFQMWAAPALVDLNLSHNKLKQLPTSPESYLGLSLEGVCEDHSQGAAIEMVDCEEPSSVPGTPHRSKPSTQDSDRASTPTAASIDTLSEEEEGGAAHKMYKEFSVVHHNYWQERVHVHAASLEEESNVSKDKRCKLHELNLSHNSFDSVPVGIVCLAPQLSKLNLAHNKLTQIGSLSAFPGGLKWLDLSHNQILGHILFDSVKFEDEGPFSERWAGRQCYSPFPTPKTNKSKGQSSGCSTPAMKRSNRANSNSSLSSVPGQPSLTPPAHAAHTPPPHGVFPCIHRGHQQLQHLKTLKLDHNKLYNLTLTMDSDTSGQLESSGEEVMGQRSAQRSPAHSAKGSSKRTSTQSEHALLMRSRLLYPNMTVLDVCANSLTSLPTEISDMTNLTELKIRNNKIKEMPPELGLLKKLWNLDCGGCPVERSLQALLGEKAKKTAAILGYLKSIKEEATLYNRMKLMFVGVQGIGKTSLLNHLRKEGKSSSPKNKNWAQRMGHSTGKDKDLRGENISTVGVDIGDLVLQRANQQVIFRTWDFGGQREYYATHQYFLSKRSLYLVVWKVTEGEKGVNDIMQWLVNIQARAPNSPVIIVGTHTDQITKKRNYPQSFIDDMGRLIFDKYMSHPEPEKWGLPRVVGHVEVTCKPRLMASSHISDLVSLIMNVVCDEQLGSKGVRLVEQKVPASYVQLQDVVLVLAEQRKNEGKDPVLSVEQYRPMVMNKMEEMYSSSFRDVAELNQATQFLHENGVLLHYDDVNLQDIYFLDPQWLCDMLANVVTIREINSLAKCGIMRSDDLKLLFKNAAFKPEDIKTYIIDLLNKFEVALLWDEKSLLIPSLLPTEESVRMNLPQTDVRIPVRGCESPAYQRARFGSGDDPQVLCGPSPSRLPRPREEGQSTFYVDPVEEKRKSAPQRKASSSTFYVDEIREKKKILKHEISHVLVDGLHIEEVEQNEKNVKSSQQNETVAKGKSETEECAGVLPKITNCSNPAVALVRLYLMSYFPSGFWPRLITRLLGDSTIYNIVLTMYELPSAITKNEVFMRQRGSCPEWKCWQTGVELRYLGLPLLRIKESPRINPNTFCDYRQCKLVIRQEQDIDWSTLNLNSTSVLELVILNETLTVQSEFVEALEGADEEGHYEQCVVLQPAPQVVASLMAKMVDHVDTLLEDWYPDLGARFVQNSRGMYLITRVVPCIRCLIQQKEVQETRSSGPEAWSMVDVSPMGDNPCISQPIFIDQNHSAQHSAQHGSLHPGSVDALSLNTTSTGSESSDEIADVRFASVPPDGTAGNTLLGTMYGTGKAVMETVGGIYNKTAEVTGGILPRFDKFWSSSESEPSGEVTDRIYCYLVEQCLLAAQLNRVVFCPIHGNMGPYFIASLDGRVQNAHAAPDAVFQDIGDQYLVEPDNICRGKFLGKGSFGAVFAGTMVHKKTGDFVNVAMKMLQPVNPGPEASPSQQQQYQAEKTRWDKEPMKNACEAYLNARKELSILLTLHHPHIVPLLGISLQPLCLILSLAPLGALNDRLKEYRRAGARMHLHVIQRVIMQVASALSYLHQCQIIYRDLKSENILAWSLPLPHTDDPMLPVHVKLADYGVSRTVLPSGAKGFAGTPPFIAPEIIQHSGEEAYTEKVDCFSFGMFIYELIMLKVPFEDGESGAAVVANLKGHILAGGRPPITLKELSYPTHLLDLMTLCWSHDPGDRPSADEIMSIVSSPYFSHLKDVVSLEEGVDILCACAAPVRNDPLSDTEGSRAVDVWLATRPSHQTHVTMLVYTFDDQHCTNTKVLELSDGMTVSCMCVTRENVWVSDTSANIHVYSLDDYSPMLKFPATTKPNIQVQTMTYCSHEERVFIVLDSGRLAVCEADFPGTWGPSYSPVQTECPGNGKPIHCLATLPKSDRCSELWCGQGRGRVSVWNLHNTKGSLHTASHGLDTEIEGKDVMFVVTSPSDHNSVWSYIYPGSEVYHWIASSRIICGKLDVSHAVPLQDHNPHSKLLQNGHLIASKCQVTTMSVMFPYLFVGTTWGCVVVADASSMRQLSVIRCHGDDMPYLQVSLPLVSWTGTSANHSGANIKEAGLLTIGRGYRDLISQYIKMADNKKISKKTSMYLLSWQAGDWK